LLSPWAIGLEGDAVQPDRGVFDTDLPKQVLQNEYLVIHFKGMKLANSL
jgi:hypothetical protein